VSPHERGRTLAGTHGHGPSWATGKWALPLKLFSKLTQSLKFKTKVFPMSKDTQILPVDSLKHKEQLSLLGQPKFHQDCKLQIQEQIQI
jgi:hypothetical protein